ncbi:hypothetical protein ABIA33_005123 [Streptacidiphilus sp. MAP12-16]
MYGSYTPLVAASFVAVFLVVDLGFGSLSALIAPPRSVAR